MAVSVSAASPAEWPAAGRVLFAGGDPGAGTARFLEFIAAGLIDPGGVFVARDRGGVCGAMLVQPFAGALGTAWPPAVPAGPGRELVEDALAAAALGWLWAGGAKVVQALLRPAEPGGSALLRAGFDRVTELAFLAVDLPPLPPQSRGEREPNDPALTLEPYSPANAAAFAGVLMASYDGTLDCPELNGTRSADEVVAGYRDAGPGGTREWFLASTGSVPVGVLMLTAPPAGAWVLTYLGVVPAARGRGAGRALTRTAVGRAAAAGAPGSSLNVDVRNEPARRLYAGEGFAEYDRREVYLAFSAQRAESSQPRATPWVRARGKE
jgi:ribosomal protein S18 acetylase RimI-like enzyme